MKQKVIGTFIMCLFLPACFIGQGNGIKKAMILNGVVLATGAVSLSAGISAQEESRGRCDGVHGPCFNFDGVGGQMLGGSINSKWIGWNANNRCKLRQHT